MFVNKLEVIQFNYETDTIDVVYSFKNRLNS